MPRENIEVDGKRLSVFNPVTNTFVASMYLPCHHDSSKAPTISGNKVEVVIAHPDVDHVDVLTIPEIPKLANNKHLSIRNMKSSYKLVKKVYCIRKFHRPNSVFANWHVDTKKNMEAAFQLDAQFLKAYKFIKDPRDLAATLEVLKEYFTPLRLQFLSLCCSPKSYPVVTWLDFSSAC